MSQHVTYKALWNAGLDTTHVFVFRDDVTAAQDVSQLCRGADEREVEMFSFAVSPVTE